jgi:hypothetical protein
MRLVRTVICVAALGSMSASAASAHVWLARAALGAGPGSQFVDDSTNNNTNSRKSKLPCNSEHPPSYCKPNTGSN